MRLLPRRDPEGEPGGSARAEAGEASAARPAPIPGEGAIGLFLLLLWVAALFEPHPFYWVFHFFGRAAKEWDSGFLIAAAGVLVLINTLRALLLYPGWFLVGDALGNRRQGRRGSRIARLIPLVAIPLCYVLATWMDRPPLPRFGASLMLGTASVWLLQTLTESLPGWREKFLALGLLLFSIQWLDVIPLLTPLGFGQGDLSGNLKILAGIMRRSQVLDLVGGAAFLGVFAGGLATTGFLAAKDRQVRQAEQLRRQEEELVRLREEQLLTRNLRELQNLVHDLKRPLTSVIGLADLLRITVPEGAGREHAGVILDAANSMNRMVDEILRPEFRQVLPAGRVLEYALSQVSALGWRERIRVEADREASEAPLSVNLVRLSRALVNLLDNANRADRIGRGEILLRLRREGERAVFEVADRGPGCPKDAARRGRSGWSSTGLGLAFATEVARGHGGDLEIRCEEGGGARVRLDVPLLPPVGEGGRER